jgi:hypothetical protein
MPGRYLQLDVCQAAPESYNQGTTCPQSVANDDPKSAAPSDSDSPVGPENTAEYLLRLPLLGGRDGR